MELLTKFNQFIQQGNLFQKSDGLLLAVSGGVDSVVLCELCHQVGYNFVMAHCNFQLRGEESDRDEAFAVQLSINYKVPFFVKKFDTTSIAKSIKKSIEETARDLRYQWFQQLLSQSENNPIKHILTAHHADDNIETVLMNFFRGTGIKGLRGILPKQGNIVRPLLFAKRIELEAFATANQLAYVTDRTNATNEYTRNFFRNSIIPQISERYPEAKENVLKNIQRFTEVEILYQQAIALHKKKLLEQKGNEVHIPVLKLLKTSPLPTVLYEIIKDFGFTALQTEDAVSLLKSDTGKYIQSATHRILKNRNWLIITPVKNNLSINILIDEKDKKIEFEQGEITIQLKPITQHQLQTDSSIAQLDVSQIKFPLLLRKWKQGDYFYPLGMDKKKKLSRFFIDQKLSISQKENIWVIEMDKKIVWVVGMRIDNRFKIIHTTKAILSLTFKR
jgi:tRNA(Ile)-lysidine synthase